MGDDNCSVHSGRQDRWQDSVLLHPGTFGALFLMIESCRRSTDAGLWLVLGQHPRAHIPDGSAHVAAS